MSKEKAIIIFTVAIDVIGLGIIIPVLPLYVESFGLSAFSVTLLFSVFSLFSFLSAPFLGVLSDKIGRRPVLLISIFSTSIGWFIFALAHSLPLLLLGRIIDGMAAGNFSTAQSSISDLSKDAKERTANLGIIGMIFGLGFIVGPFIGGILSKVSHSFPFWFVGALALVNVTLAYFFLPETNKNLDKDKKITWNPLRPLFSAISNKGLRLLYFIWFLVTAVSVLSNTVFALYLNEVFNFNPLNTGLFFTGLGLILTLNQGFLIRKFWLVKFREKQLIHLMLLFYFFGLLIMAVPFMAFFVVGIIFTAFGQSTLGIAMTSEIVGEADLKARGEAVGILSAISSIAMIVTPLLSGSLFQIKPNFPYLLAAGLCLIALILMQKAKMSEKKNLEIVEEAKEVIA